MSARPCRRCGYEKDDHGFMGAMILRPKPCSRYASPVPWWLRLFGVK